MKIINICVLLLLISCINKAVYKNNIPQNDNKCILNCNDVLLCYKYLYNDDTFVMVNEKTFWIYGKEYNEFSYKKIDASFEDILKSIKTLEKKNYVKDFTYTYAFVNNCQDTIYADYKLNRWIIKKDGISNYYEYNKQSGRKVDTLNTKGLTIYDKFFKY